MDLVNLARTSKALRGVLMSRKSIWVWLVARRNAGVTKAPNPPDDMSEPAWALLLFGPAVCSVVLDVSDREIPLSLVPAVKFRYQCPGLNESVMELLPHTKSMISVL